MPNTPPDPGLTGSDPWHASLLMLCSVCLLSGGWYDQNLPLKYELQTFHQKYCNINGIAEWQPVDIAYLYFTWYILLMWRMQHIFFRASSNQKVKETVALELSFVNSNLQLLKEELEELNSSMNVYQTERLFHFNFLDLFSQTWFTWLLDKFQDNLAAGASLDPFYWGTVPSLSFNNLLYLSVHSFTLIITAKKCICNIVT